MSKYIITCILNYLCGKHISHIWPNHLFGYVLVPMWPDNPGQTVYRAFCQLQHNKFWRDHKTKKSIALDARIQFMIAIMMANDTLLINIKNYIYMYFLVSHETKTFYINATITVSV